MQIPTELKLTEVSPYFMSVTFIGELPIKSLVKQKELLIRLDRLVWSLRIFLPKKARTSSKRFPKD